MKIGLVIAVTLYLLSGAYLYFFQTSFIYHPTPSQHADPADEMTFQSDDARIAVSTAGVDQRKALLYFGGNAEDVTVTIRFYKRYFPTTALYFMHYRGYGGSSGQPSEEVLKRDALRLYDHVAARHGDVAVVGRSLGTGIATYVAAKKPVTQLVLVTPYDTMLSVAQSHYPYFPIGPLLREQYCSVCLAKDVAANVTILMAENDVVIPAHCTLALYRGLDPAKTQLVTIKNVGHNDISDDPSYFPTVRAALGE